MCFFAVINQMLAFQDYTPQKVPSVSFQFSVKFDCILHMTSALIICEIW